VHKTVRFKKDPQQTNTTTKAFSHCKVLGWNFLQN